MGGIFWDNRNEGLGKIIDEEEDAVKVMYSENPWKRSGHSIYLKKWQITRFKTQEEALKKHMANLEERASKDKNLTPDKIRKHLKEIFPSYFQKEK